MALWCYGGELSISDASILNSGSNTLGNWEICDKGDSDG